MPSAAPAHALLSAAHSLLRPATHYGRPPPAPLPIDEVALPAGDVADLRDVFDAINELCDAMRSSTAGREDEPADDVRVSRGAASTELSDSTEQVEELETSDARQVLARASCSIVGPEMSVAEEWSETVIRDALAGSDRFVLSDIVDDEWSSIFKKVVHADRRESGFQDDRSEEEPSVHLVQTVAGEQIGENVQDLPTVQNVVSAERSGGRTLETLVPEEHRGRSFLDTVASAKQCVGSAQDEVLPAGHRDGSARVAVVAAEQSGEGAGQDSVVSAVHWGWNVRDAVVPQWRENVEDVAPAEEWGEVAADEVVSDGEPALNWEAGGSEPYYTASSEVSLVSEEGACVAAGHVAAMRERFESMTRATTPCVEHAAASRDRSPSPAPPADRS